MSVLFFVSEHFASVPEPAFRLASTSVGSTKMFLCGKASVAPVCSWTFFMSTRSHMAASSFGYRHCESLTAADLPLVSN